MGGGVAEDPSAAGGPGGGCDDGTLRHADQLHPAAEAGFHEGILVFRNGDGQRGEGVEADNERDFEAVRIPPVAKGGVVAGVAGVAIEFRDHLAFKIGAVEEVELGSLDDSSAGLQFGREKAEREEAGVDRGQPTDDGAMGNVGRAGESLLVQYFTALRLREAEERFKSVEFSDVHEIADVLIEKANGDRPRWRGGRGRKDGGGKAAERFEGKGRATLPFGESGAVELECRERQGEAAGGGQHKAAGVRGVGKVGDEFGGAVEIVNESGATEASEKLSGVGAGRGARGGIVEGDIGVCRELTAQ